MLTPTITFIDATGPQIRAGFKLAASGNYSTGGDTVNLAGAAAAPSFIGMVPQIEALGAPIAFNVWDQSGQITYIIAPVAGTTQSNNKVKFATALTSELSADAYPAGLTGAQLVGEAVFNKL